MKIVYFIESFDQKAGIERVTTSKANYLAREHNYDVTIVTAYSQSVPDSYTCSSRIHRESLHLEHAKNSANPFGMITSRLAISFKAISRFNKLMDKIKPDIIVYTWVLGAMLLPFTKHKSFKIYESHTPLHRIPFPFLQKYAAKAADKVVCLTNGDANEYRKYTNNVIVIPNFVDNQKVTCKSYAVHRAIAVGRLSKEKGYDILLKAWRKAIVNNQDWILHICGEGEERELLECQIKELQLSKNVILRGNIEDVMSEYAKSSMQIMSSHYEGLPMTLIEGQTCGLACVSSDFKYGARDIIENGKNGIIADLNDTEAYSNALTTLMKDETLRKCMGMEAEKRSIDYSAEVIISRWIELFNSPISV